MVTRCKPLTKDHLLLKTAFAGIKGWSVVTGFTVHAQSGRLDIDRGRVLVHSKKRLCLHSNALPYAWKLADIIQRSRAAVAGHSFYNKINTSSYSTSETSLTNTACDTELCSILVRPRQQKTRGSYRRRAESDQRFCFCFVFFDGRIIIQLSA